jgi:photosystem II stability/assembly factor-like uncharacterized protein
MYARQMGRYALALAVLVLPALSVAQPTTADLIKGIEFRSLGPSVSGGRIVDLEVHPSAPNTIYAAAASGGLWKSVNNGTTWNPIFDNQATISIGDVAIAPSNPNIIWVGTGEHNNQRSALFGDGVYKSVDGGKTWQNMGLKDTVRIGRIVVDSRNPDIVYVASNGPLYRPGPMRGVYKTTDGGKTWDLVLRGENQTTGFIDMVADPRDSRVLYAASLDQLRRAWNHRESGPGSGLWKSTDAGRTWNKLDGGLPKGNIGRIGLAISQRNPRTLYATVINRNEGGGIEIYRTDDAGGNWRKVNEQAAQGSSYYGKIRICPGSDDRIYILGVRLQRSDNGGRTFRIIDNLIHVDHHSMWIDPANPDRIILGNDGGLYATYDRAETWWFVNNLPIMQFYAIGADMSIPYNVMGGTQDNGAWRGPSRSRVPSGIHNSDWIAISGGDGFYSMADPEDPNTIYTSSQFGNITRFDMKTRTSRSIRPRDQGQRANWMSPFQISPHNPRTLIWGANRVYRTTDRGDNWVAISPDLTTNNPEKIRGNVPHCTITTLEESAVRPGVIWVGTDDGLVWVTQNGGTTWDELTLNIEGRPAGWWVSRVHASPHDAATAFVTFTGFREDDFRPFLFKTTDYGKTWTLITGNLPNEPIAVVKQDTINPDLLVVGTELGSHITLDGGQTWSRFTNGLPTNAFQDLLIHKRDGDLILGTHGRGAFVANISPLRQMTKEVREKPVHLFQPDTALTYSFFQNMFDPFNGHMRFTSPNPQFGAPISYYLSAPTTEDVLIEVLDIQGQVLRRQTGSKEAGLHSIQWDLRGGEGQRRALVPPGQYLVRLTHAGNTQTRVINVIPWE